MDIDWNILDHPNVSYRADRNHSPDNSLNETFLEFSTNLNINTELNFFSNTEDRLSPPFDRISPIFQLHQNRFSNIMAATEEEQNNDFTNDQLETELRNDGQTNNDGNEQEHDPNIQDLQRNMSTTDSLLDIYKRLTDITTTFEKEDKKVTKLFRKEIKEKLQKATTDIQALIHSEGSAIKYHSEQYTDLKFQNHPLLRQITSISALDALIDSKIQTALTNHTTSVVPSSSSSTIKTPLPSLKKKSQYRRWRQDVATHCAVSPAYSHLTTTNNKNEFQLRSSLPKLDNARLYSIITQAVASDLTEPFTTADPSISLQSDGLRLLQEMETQYNKVETDFLTQSNLLNTIQNIYKEHNESYLLYTARFTRQVSMLREAVQGGGSIQVPPDNMLAYYFIKGLRRPQDFKEMLLDLQADNINAKQYYTAGNINHTMREAEKRLRSLALINAHSSPACIVIEDTPSPMLSSPTKTTRPSSTSSKQKPQQQQKQSPEKQQEKQPLPRSSEMDEFYAELSKDIPGTLQKWYNRNTTKCSLNHGDHAFFDCRYIKSLLYQRKQINHLDELKKKVQSPSASTIKAKQMIVDASAYEDFLKFQNRTASSQSSINSAGISAISSDFSESEYSSDKSNDTNDT